MVLVVSSGVVEGGALVGEAERSVVESFVMFERGSLVEEAEEGGVPRRGKV